MTIEKVGDMIARQAWSSHELTQRASLAQEVRVRLLAEEVIRGLRYYYGAGQPEQGVFLDKQHGNVGITVNPNSEWEFCRIGGIQQVIFETNQYKGLGDRSLRRLTIRGNHPEDIAKRWEEEFVIGGEEIKKKERNQPLPFEQANAGLILYILGGIRDKVNSLKLNERR